MYVEQIVRPVYQFQDKRRRGVILTKRGFQKLQEAKYQAEMEENDGKRYTLENMSERTGLAVNTLMKVHARQTKVDKQTLKICFQAFNLVLEPEDYTKELPSQTEEDKFDRPMLELPDGQVPLSSMFYVERSEIESECYQAILQPGALIRIKAPRRMGKTSLMARVLDRATQKNYQTVYLSFQLADKEIFQSLDYFLRWFCANVGLGLHLPNKLEDYWDPIFGSQVSCKTYFEQYLLVVFDKPLVLALDDVDFLFDYPELASNFFGLLRTWHEEAKNREIWQKLRLVVVHSTNLYIPLTQHKSPFNVGLPVELLPFTDEQVEGLAQEHGLDWCKQQAGDLTNFMGGNPYLIRAALYNIASNKTTLEDILKFSESCIEIYKEHLQTLLYNLQQDFKLLAAFAKVLNNQAPVELELVEGFKLQSWGLIRLEGDRATISCSFYSLYFGERL